MGVTEHVGLHVLCCLTCQSYLTPSTLKTHMEKHGLSVDAVSMTHAVEYCQCAGIHKSQSDVLLPTANGPPVKFLKVVSGYRCQEDTCSHAAVDWPTLRSHEKNVHAIHGNRSSESHPRYQLQTLFHNPIQYFVVNPSLFNSSNPSLLSALAAEFIPRATAPAPLLTPTDDRGRTPLQIELQLDDLMYDVRRSRDLLHLLSSLKNAHGKDEDDGIYTRLTKCVEDLHDALLKSMKGHQFRFDMERTIIYGLGTIPVSR